MARAVSKGRDFWQLALDRQRSSGLSVAAFCRQESLSDKTFYLWRRKLLAEQRDQPTRQGFTELVINQDQGWSGTPGAGPCVELTFDNGSRLLVSNIASNDQLERILATLRATS